MNSHMKRIVGASYDRRCIHSFFSNHHTTLLPSYTSLFSNFYLNNCFSITIPHSPTYSIIYQAYTTMATIQKGNKGGKKQGDSGCWLGNHVMAKVYLFGIFLVIRDIEQKCSFPVLGLLHRTR